MQVRLVLRPDTNPGDDRIADLFAAIGPIARTTAIRAALLHAIDNGFFDTMMQMQRYTVKGGAGEAARMAAAPAQAPASPAVKAQEPAPSAPSADQVARMRAMNRFDH